MEAFFKLKSGNCQPLLRSCQLQLPFCLDSCSFPFLPHRPGHGQFGFCPQY